MGDDTGTPRKEPHALQASSVPGNRCDRGADRGGLLEGQRSVDHHHEHLDGTGYPRGLRGHEIAPQVGKTIFSANCATCHGATGTEGGVGPSLKNEKSRKNYAQTIAWIHNPTPPMPKLWPSPLNDKDVQDVAAYVQSL